MNHFSKATINKIGNAIIYIVEKTNKPSKTKILKLLYLFEEQSAISYGVPFFGIDFEVWKQGPVNKLKYLQFFIAGILGLTFKSCPSEEIELHHRQYLHIES